jgi:hypothetical protein
VIRPVADDGKRSNALDVSFVMLLGREDGRGSGRGGKNCCARMTGSALPLDVPLRMLLGEKGREVWREGYPIIGP